MSAMLVSTVQETKRYEWDPADEASVEKVKEEFDKIVGSNFAYKTTGSGTKEQIREFDPTAEEIFVASPLFGG